MFQTTNQNLYHSITTIPVLSPLQPVNSGPRNLIVSSSFSESVLRAACIKGCGDISDGNIRMSVSLALSPAPELAEDLTMIWGLTWPIGNHEATGQPAVFLAGHGFGKLTWQHQSEGQILVGFLSWPAKIWSPQVGENTSQLRLGSCRSPSPVGWGSWRWARDGS